MANRVYYTLEKHLSLVNCQTCDTQQYLIGRTQFVAKGRAGRIGNEPQFLRFNADARANHSMMQMQGNTLGMNGKPLADMMKPGLQKPHCAQPKTIQATWRGCRLFGVSRPSIISISALSATFFIFTIQERTTSPLRIIKHVPH